MKKVKINLAFLIGICFAINVISGCKTKDEFNLNNYKDLITANQISVYSMQVDGKDFYKAYQTSDYMFFTFGTSGGSYTIDCNLLNATSIKPLALITNGNPKLVPNPAAANPFNLEASQLSDDNIKKFFTKLISTGFKFDNETDAADYYVNFEVYKIEGTGNKAYAKISITASKKASPNTYSAKYVNPNPCPPCHTGYSGN